MQTDHLRAPQPPMVKELQTEARKRGLWNLFLPEVSKISVLEYSPIAELLGAIPLVRLFSLLFSVFTNVLFTYL